MKMFFAAITMLLIVGCTTQKIDEKKLQRLEEVAQVLQDSNVDAATLKKMAALSNQIQMNEYTLVATNKTLMLVSPKSK